MDKKIFSRLFRFLIFASSVGFLSTQFGCDFVARKKSQDVIDSYNFDHTQSFFVGFSENLKKLDWNLTTDFASSVVETNIMDGLTRIDTDSEGVHVMPALATHWDVSNNGLRYTFYLRPGVKWSDGQPLRAQDFVDSVYRLFNLNSVWAENLNYVHGARALLENKSGHLNPKQLHDLGISAPNDNTVIFNLTEALNYFPAVVAHRSLYPVRLDLVNKFGSSWSDPKNLATLGAYTIMANPSDKALILAKNPNYSLRPAILKNLIFRFDLTSSEMSQLLKEGQLNVIADLQSEQLKDFQKRSDVLETSLLDLTYIAFDVKTKTVSNPIFRRAIATSIDREEVARSLMNTVKPVSDVVPPGLIGYESNRGSRYAPDVARDLLKHSGYGSLKGLVPFNLKVDPGSEARADVLNIRDQLQSSLGLVIKIVKYTDDPISEKEKVPTMILHHWVARVPDPHDFLSLFTSDSKFNVTGWKNRDYDLLVRQASVSSSTDTKEKLYSKAQHLLIEREIPVIPLYVSSRFCLVPQKVQHFPLNVLGLMPFRGVDLE